MERELVDRARGGDKAAFTRLVRLHQDAVYRFAFYYVGSSEAAHELAQETLLRFYKTLDRFDPELPVRPWLLRIASNLCKDYFKRRRVEARYRQGGPPPSDDETAGDPGLRPDATVARSREVARVQAAVTELREDYREPLLMKCVEGMTYEEMSTVTGLPITTLKIRVVRAREQLRSMLETPKDGPYRRKTER